MQSCPAPAVSRARSAAVRLRSAAHETTLAVSILALFFGFASASQADEERRGLGALDLVSMHRLSDPQPSPDGSKIAYVLRETDLEADRGRTDLWWVASDGESEPRRLTSHESSDFSPRFAADGESLYFVSTRSGSSQVWRLPVAAGGEAEQVTDLPLDVGGFALSPDGRRLAVSLEVFVDCADAEAGVVDCTVERLENKEEQKTSGMLYDRLFVRHWDTWKDGRRSHLFVVPAGPSARAGSHDASRPVDVSRGLDADVPSKPFGGFEEITWTPDSRGLVFAARVEKGSDEARSTNFDLYHAPADGSSPARRLTDNPAWDTQPQFSPDGKTLAYLAMERPGFEADRLVLTLRSWSADGQLGAPRALTDSWDRSVGGFFFAEDGQALYATAGDIGNVGLFAIDAKTGQVSTIWRQGHVRSPSQVGDRLVFGLDTLDRPVDLYSLPVPSAPKGRAPQKAKAMPKRLTDVNRARLAEIEMGAYEQFSFAGWNDETVYGYLVKPAGYEEGQRYPVAFLIHGGPQGSFDNDFHYRWNPQTYAGAGYAVVTIDFHGSTGYGQAFTDSITGDWGGKPLEDLRKGWAAALERYDFLDGDRACALGASYGGYMINWIAGQWPDGFDCLVNHDGLFELESMYYSTEELWFPEWEMGGAPWEEKSDFETFDPARFVDRWKTPMLVIHGALDYRVVDTQGLATFTALQRRGIPSQLLYFPDENHWVLKPNNSMQWHEVVLDWLDRWTGSGEGSDS